MSDDNELVNAINAQTAQIAALAAAITNLVVALSGTHKVQLAGGQSTVRTVS